MTRFLFTLALGAGLALPAAVLHAQGFVVVVNAASGTTSLSKADVANAFLKRASNLTPVDQERTSKVRDAFTRAVHGRAVSAIGAYWQQQIFTGKDVPPPEKRSDADVLGFVRSTPNGIGYVAEGTPLGDGVKAVALR